MLSLVGSVFWTSWPKPWNPRGRKSRRCRDAGQQPEVVGNVFIHRSMEPIAKSILTKRKTGRSGTRWPWTRWPWTRCRMTASHENPCLTLNLQGFRACQSLKIQRGEGSGKEKPGTWPGSSGNNRNGLVVFSCYYPVCHNRG
ncbi:MAG: hypothetical protein OXI59_05990 [Gemmatimonadota bacterium]|nr:hypothetical protein [Gemmatimonadota bacterium]